MVLSAEDGVTVVTMRLVTTTVLRTVVEFHPPEGVELLVLMEPVDDAIPVLSETEDVGGGKSSLKVLLGTGGEYGGA